MNNPLNPPATQEEIKEHLRCLQHNYEDFVKRCNQTGYWDGRIREGLPLAEDIEAVYAQLDNSLVVPKTDVIIQLALQIKETGHLIKRTK